MSGSPVSGLDPPSESREPGYYDDPLGGEYPRWWDGGDWTYQVGPKPELELRARRKRTGRRLLDYFWLPVPLITAMIEADLVTRLILLVVGTVLARLLVALFLRLRPEYRPD